MNQFFSKFLVTTLICIAGMAVSAHAQLILPGQGFRGGSQRAGQTSASMPDPQTPESCRDDGQPLALNNEQVLQWKTTTPNQFLSRGHVKGLFVQAYQDRNGHHHWQMQIGPKPTDMIEVIYSLAFGPAPQAPAVGAHMIACGDYITSNKDAKFPASPDGAVIHWIHRSKNPRNHDSGYLWIEGRYYGL
jgi:hypothetical protein